VEILRRLSEIKNDKILLQRTDSIVNTEFLNSNQFLKNEAIKMNSIEGENDFSNLKWIDNFRGVTWDIFFRMLSKSKMQILDESWSFQKDKFNSQYLSEKTISLILSGIPFISTHTYPLEIIELSTGIEPHPFMEDFNRIKGNPELFSLFVNDFMLNFEENYIRCKKWSDECNKLFIDMLENKNSLLDLIIDGFKIKHTKTLNII
jgi:hypothetical protein